MLLNRDIFKETYALHNKKPYSNKQNSDIYSTADDAEDKLNKLNVKLMRDTQVYNILTTISKAC